MGGSNDGNAHASTIDISTDLGIGFLPFFCKQGGKLLQQSFGFSLRSRPSVDATKEENCLRCSRQGSKCFFFFLGSWAATTVPGALERLDLGSTLVTRTSMMQSVPRAQTPSNNQHAVATVFIAIVAKQTLDWVVMLTSTAECPIYTLR
jgi:hypothetical protein